MSRRSSGASGWNCLRPSSPWIAFLPNAVAHFWGSPEGGSLQPPPLFDSCICALSFYTMSTQPRTPKNTLKASFICFVSWMNGDLLLSRAKPQSFLVCSLTSFFLSLKPWDQPTPRPRAWTMHPHGGSSWNSVLSWTEILVNAMFSGP